MHLQKERADTYIWIRGPIPIYQQRILTLFWIYLGWGICDHGRLRNYRPDVRTGNVIKGERYGIPRRRLCWTLALPDCWELPLVGVWKDSRPERQAGGISKEGIVKCCRCEHQETDLVEMKCVGRGLFGERE